MKYWSISYISLSTPTFLLKSSNIKNHHHCWWKITIHPSIPSHPLQQRQVAICCEISRKTVTCFTPLGNWRTRHSSLKRCSASWSSFSQQALEPAMKRTGEAPGKHGKYGKYPKKAMKRIAKLLNHRENVFWGFYTARIGNVHNQNYEYRLQEANWVSNQPQSCWNGRNHAGDVMGGRCASHVVSDL